MIRARGLLAAMVLLGLACGGSDEPFSPTLETVAGTYRAASLTATENGITVDEDLAGTWTLEGSTVTFDQSGDTFIRDVPFTAEPSRLSGEGTFNGVIVRAVLTK